MLRLFLTFVLQITFVCIAQSQSFTVDDLLTLSSLSSKKFDSYMKEKGFMPGGRTMLNEAMALTFLGKNKFSAEDSVIHSRTVNLYKTNNTYCFAYHTSSLEEYLEGKKRLRKSDFFFAENIFWICSLSKKNYYNEKIMESSIGTFILCSICSK